MRHGGAGEYPAGVIRIGGDEVLVMRELRKGLADLICRPDGDHAAAGRGTLRVSGAGGEQCDQGNEE